jgi:hypothetical protein
MIRSGSDEIRQKQDAPKNKHSDRGRAERYEEKNDISFALADDAGIDSRLYFHR